MKNLAFFFTSFCVYSIFFISVSTTAQQKKEIYSSAIWIKANPKIDSDLPTGSAARGSAIGSYFNFNPVINFTKEKIQQKYKSVIEKASSLFIVFKIDGKDAVDLCTLKNGTVVTTISNQKITADTEVVFHKGDAQQGILVSYIFQKNSILSRKKGSLTFNELLFNNVEHKNNVLELIYIPRVVSEQEQNIIESYLSIKYGISLLGEKDYYDSTYHKIWDYKQNSNYNTRVTGVGKDNFLNLFQKQSGNYKKDGLYFGLTALATTNSENKSDVADKSFWIWGDNNKSTLIKKDKQDLIGPAKMERIWKMQQTQSGLTQKTFQLVLNQKEFQNESAPSDSKGFGDRLWMAIDTTGTTNFDYKKAVYLPSKDLNNGTLVFDGIVWKLNASSLFTFVHAPDLLVTTDYLTPDCIASQNGTLQINLFGGKAPYQIKLFSDTYTRTFEATESVLKIPNLAGGNYSLTVADSSRHSYTKDITISNFDTSPISIQPEWFLDSTKEVIVAPIVTNDQDIVTYEWYKGESAISQNKQFLGKEVGDYKLLVTNTKGCRESLPFSIIDQNSTAGDQWVVYPNPVTSGAIFSVSFLFKKPTKTTVTIYDLAGKLIQFKDLGAITTYQFKSTLTVSGTYMIVCSIDGTLETSKLIVK